MESILRYGLPPKFLAALMKPNQKSTARLRKTLASLFGNAGIADEACIAVVHMLASACSCCCTAAVLQRVDIFVQGVTKSAMHSAELYMAGAGTNQYFDGDDKGASGLAGDTEMYPYVSFSISVDG